MSYTSAQQSQIDVANAQLASAKSVLDNASADAQSRLADMNRCNCGKGKRGNRCVPLHDQISFPNLASTGECEEPPFVNNCKTDCCSKKTCIDRVNAYNGSISVYNTAQTNYDNAKRNLDNVLNSVGEQVKNDPSTILEKDKIAEEAKIAKLKWGFLGFIILSIIGIGTYMAFKTEIKKAYIIGGGLGIIILLYVVLFGIKSE